MAESKNSNPSRDIGTDAVSEEYKEMSKIPYLRSCLKECDSPIKAHVKGTIPLWVNGTLLRNGPGMMQIGDTKYKHVFDGLSLIQRYHIENGEVYYMNKFLRSDTYEKNMKAKRIVVSEFGTRAYPDPCLSIWGRLMSYFRESKPDISDNDNVNIYPVGDQLFAATETQYIRRIDPKTLESHEKVDLSKYLTINTATAHAHVDNNGNVYNVGSSYGPSGKYHVFKIPSEDKPFDNAKIECSIKMRDPLNPAYFHSFSITENYYIFIEQSLALSVKSLMMGSITGNAFGDCLKWHPETPVRFHVIKRSNGEELKTQFTSDPFAFFHTINAYEDNDNVIIDICCYPNGQIVKALADNVIKDSRNALKNSEFTADSASEVRRFVLPLKDSNENVHIKHETLLNGHVSGELPRINYEKFNGKKYRYFYSIARKGNDHLNCLLKYDIETRESILWSEDKHFPSEPVFVRRSKNENDDDEDDGVILSAVLSEDDETKGFLLILDAKTFKEVARASFQTPSALTADFHGLFINN